MQKSYEELLEQTRKDSAKSEKAAADMGRLTREKG